MPTATSKSWSSTAIKDYSHSHPPLASSVCLDALTELVQDNATLAISTEASSHPSGLQSLFGQPWLYAGGGLGNYNECPTQFCLAGGTSRDSFVFAGVCLPWECSAYDVDAPDYLPKLDRVVQTSSNPLIAQDYFNLQARIRELNHVLRTGWTCGLLVIPWNVGWSTLYFAIMTLFVVLGILGTYKCQKRQQQETAIVTEEQETMPYNSDEEEKKESGSPIAENGNNVNSQRSADTGSCTFWNAWNWNNNYKMLFQHRPDTACLDGTRVGSILWIILGHCMAIQSSVGAGYNNPSHFLPPHGLTTTLGGQLLFASRFAVDTFFCISGYLAVRILLAKLPRVQGEESLWFVWQYFKTIPAFMLHRILRILPLYGVTLGFWILVAPHCGGGPFWYQWLALLQPCAEYGWTNWAFVNNFIPADKANTETCFYHSWYLAMDVQLFVMAPFLVWWYRQSKVGGKRATAFLWLVSVGVTMYLSHSRKWSINTFDGAAVARFDVEGYAKPHVRAQSYLSGMLLAMFLDSRGDSLKRRTTVRHVVFMASAITALLSMTFATVTGAYSRRPCRYEEWPLKDECGSTWSLQATFWYTATARAVWSCAIAILLGLCLQGRGGVIGKLLSLPIWTPLSHLTFGAYLVHPIVIFVWQLGDTQKEYFSLVTFGMNYIAVTVVSFGAALVLALLVEFPSANLQKHYLGRRKGEKQNYKQPWSTRASDAAALLSKQSTSSLSDPSVEMYGSLNGEGCSPRGRLLIP